jgi:hypothetical protein
VRTAEADAIAIDIITVRGRCAAARRAGLAWVFSRARGGLPPLPGGHKESPRSTSRSGSSGGSGGSGGGGGGGGGDGAKAGTKAHHHD